MKFFRFFVRYALFIGLFTLALAIIVNVFSGFWPAFVLYFLGLVAIAWYFFVGPIALVQEPLERGDMDEVNRILDSVRYPQLLIKPVRSAFYQLKGNMAMMNKDNQGAEDYLKKSKALGSMVPEAAYATELQLGMLAMQNNNMRQAETHIRAALKAGIPDNENKAMALLGMVQIFMNKREFRAAKDFFRQAKAQKPKNEQIVGQIKEIEKYISRIPG